MHTTTAAARNGPQRPLQGLGGSNRYNVPPSEGNGLLRLYMRVDMKVPSWPKTILLAIAANTRHGESRGWKQSAEYTAWRNMWTRCTNPNTSHYKHYGGRGVGICDAWKDFTAFLHDMGRRPTDRHTLDRINSNGNYEPSNCRWATRQQQSENREFVRKVGGRPLPEVAREVGIPAKVLYQRIFSRGWSEERAGVNSATWCEGNFKLNNTHTHTP